MYKHNIKETPENIVNIKFTKSECNITKRNIYAVKGDASSDSAGLIAAISGLVAKLEPKSKPPIISLQNDSR